ncbi:MAG: alpha-L-arabinofuranosidase C-terminal domain-containing protein, partial [Candidatus Ornithomonoglobus sp.]
MTSIKIDTEKIHNEISPMLYGIFFEDINYAGDGGLYAELIANRSFSYYDDENSINMHKLDWESIGNAVVEIRTSEPLNSANKHYAYIKGNAGEGFGNTGFCGEGFAVKKGERYNFTCIARSAESCALEIRIRDSKNNVIAKKPITLNSTKWNRYSLTFTAPRSVKHAYIEIVFSYGGEAEFAFISLFPQNTYKGRKNGLRADLAGMLEDLKPKFIRFPGGCVVEGRSFDTMYRWKETIGDITERPTNKNRWQMDEYQPGDNTAHDYFQSYGLGYYEYFQLCEDIGAKPVPVMNCGMTCQWHEGLLIDCDKLEPWIKDIIDLIEFANGDEGSEWGAKRIAMGHKEPFNLEYIGIGNEQWGQEYFERYEIFQKRLSELYPDIKLITCAGYAPDGDKFDFAMNWMRENKNKAYAADEHFYKTPEWFLDNTDRYDNYDRTLPKVFAGEYAAHTSRNISERRNNWYTALAEAAFLTGVERNADHVVMTCYAPLFGRTGHQQWQPDLIWFDNDSVYGTPNYYVQKLFSNYTGDNLVEAECADSDIKIAASITSDGSRLFVKLVNLSDKEKHTNLWTGKYNTGTVHELSAALDAENSHTTPK